MEKPAEQTENEIIEERNSKVGNTVVRRYAKRRFLGKGGFARCYEIEDLETHKISAIKIVAKETLKKSKAKQKLVTEIKIHKSLEHRNVLLFDHVFEDSQNVYIILELCSHHTLNQMMKRRKRITEPELQYYLHQLIQGLTYVHRQKVIHRDLKLGNLMLNEQMELKIGDFGLAAKLEYPGEKRKTICGTPNYLAPEIVTNSGHSYEVDVWSLGVITYTLLYGRPPFETSDVKKTYRRIRQCQYTFNEDVSVSINARNLISRILVVDPSKRLSLDEILTHPFMTSSRIPKQLQSSVLSQAPSRTSLETQSGITPNTSNKYVVKEAQTNLERVKSEKGISERLLLRTTTGLNRNLFFNKQGAKEDLYQLKSNPQLLSNNYFKPDSAKPGSRALHGCHGIYVKKWVDYSSKYGLGYLLSDGTTGIYFNDSTKMVLDEHGQKVDYVSSEGEDGKCLQSFTVSNCPDEKELSKKLTLMQYFRKYLQSGGSQGSGPKADGPPFVYIKKWMKSDQAVLFRLNNKLVQVNFNDKSQIMLYTQKDLLLYSSAQGKDKQIIDINSNDLKKYPEILKRLEHVKQILRKMAKNCSTDNQTDLLAVEPLRC